jgi:hypothetical protein
MDQVGIAESRGATLHSSEPFDQVMIIKEIIKIEMEFISELKTMQLTVKRYLTGRYWA